MGFFSNLFSTQKKEDNPYPGVDVDAIISNIKSREQAEEIPLGKKIYSFDYQMLEIRFDRDITHNGRICIFQGKERLFSFTVFVKQGEYDILKEAFSSVLQFLNTDRSIKKLPENELLKGFYHH